jgi:hypothetical protein
MKKRTWRNYGYSGEPWHALMAALDWIDEHPGWYVPARGSMTAGFALAINAFLREQYRRNPDWLRNFEERETEGEE